MNRHKRVMDFLELFPWFAEYLLNFRVDRIQSIVTIFAVKAVCQFITLRICGSFPDLFKNLIKTSPLFKVIYKVNCLWEDFIKVVF